jgi:hypothetical protein
MPNNISFYTSVISAIIEKGRKRQKGIAREHAGNAAEKKAELVA